MPATLLTLPRELRDQIYGYCLPTESQVFRFSLGVGAVVPAILQASRKLRKETIKLYYGKSGFDLIIHHQGIKVFRLWVQGLSRRAILYLRRNTGINVRFIYDKYHKDYPVIRDQTAKAAMIMANPKGWFVTAEDQYAERVELRYMQDVPELRERHGYPRPCDRRPASDVCAAVEEMVRGLYGVAMLSQQVGGPDAETAKNEARDLLRADVKAKFQRVHDCLQDRWAEQK